MKILLVQLGSNGDCLFVTTIAKQIKETDYPGCSLTWLIGSKYSHLIDNNHFIDDKIILEINDINDLWFKRNNIDNILKKDLIYKNFDKIFITDFTKDNSKYRYGTTRSTLFRSYENKITISPEPQIFLRQFEIDNVFNFCKKKSIIKGENNILFECSPQSGQSNINVEKAIKIAQFVTNKNRNIKFILSSNVKFNHKCDSIIDASTLTFRENAELINYCNLIIGCSSGLTWLSTSNWSKKIPMIQSISPHFKNNIIPASVKTDFKFFGLNFNHIIELYDPNEVLIANCVESFYKNGLSKTRIKYDEFRTKMFSNYRLIFNSKINPIKKIFLLLYIFFIRSFKIMNH